MPFWNQIRNLAEAIGTLIEGLEPYEYAVLPTETSIRLLSFEEDDLRMYSVSLTTVELEQAPPFHALSYTWHNPHQFPHLEEGESDGPSRLDYWKETYSRPVSFKCNGKKIVVRPGRNLHEFFQRFWNADESLKWHKYLWADAICINQADLKERKAQILIMGDIYRRADSVVAWLGEGLRGTGLAFDALNTLAGISFADLEKMQNMSIRDPETYRALGVSPLNFEHILAVAGFLGRKWFNRIWIVQEAVFAREILFVCGGHTIQPTMLFNIGKLLVLSGWSSQMMDMVRIYIDINVPPPGAVASLALMRDDMRGPRAQKLIDIMASIRSRQSKLAVDRVYGMLNVIALASNKAPKELDVQPDYSRPAPSVMEDATRMLIRYEKSLIVLHQVQDRSVVAGLPGWDGKDAGSGKYASWTVHWGERMLPQPLPVISRFAADWQPSGPMPTENPDLSAPHELRFRAALLGEIAEVAADHPMNWTPLLELALKLRGRPYGVPTAQGLYEILWRTTMADSAGSESPAPAELGDGWAALFVVKHAQTNGALTHGGGFFLRLAVDEEMQRLVRDMRATDPGSKLPDAASVVDLAAWLRGEREDAELGDNRRRLEEAAQSVVVFVETAMTGRCLARTENNFLTLVPKSAKTSDQVWVIPGLACPFVLREKGAGEFYEFVGEAYVHGAMKGEMAGQLSFRTISLR